MTVKGDCVSQKHTKVVDARHVTGGELVFFFK